MYCLVNSYIAHEINTLKLDVAFLLHVSI